MSELFQEKREAKLAMQKARKKAHRRMVKQRQLEDKFTKFETRVRDSREWYKEVNPSAWHKTLNSYEIADVESICSNVFPYVNYNFFKVILDDVKRRPDSADIIRFVLANEKGNQLKPEMVYLLCCLEGDIEENLELALQLPASYFYALFGVEK